MLTRKRASADVDEPSGVDSIKGGRLYRKARDPWRARRAQEQHWYDQQMKPVTLPVAPWEQQND